MKTRIYFGVTIGLFAATLLARGADTLTQSLQQGLFEEEANHNLDAAIKAYQSVVSQSEEQRKVIATALFRLGECYRKLGKTNEANAQYERVLRDFSEQEQLVKLSREHVKAHPMAPSSAPGIVTQAQMEDAAILAQTKALLKESPDLVNSRDPSAANYGDTRLHSAVRKRYVSVVEFLLENHANVNAENAQHQTPLHLAAIAGNNSMVELLLVHGADANRNDDTGWTPLQYTVDAGYKTVVESLLAHKADVRASGGGYGYQPLHLAARNGFAGICEVLLDHGAEIGAGAKSDRATALHLAANGGHREVVELLLKRKAPVDTRDGGGATPLQWAARSGRSDAVEILLEAGADPNSRNNKGESPLFDVLNTDVIKLLLGHKADPNLKSRNGATALSELVRQTRPFEPIEMLLDGGADPNVPLAGVAANPPLILNAVGVRNVRLVELLLNHNANPNVVLHGDTPLSRAQWYIRQYASSTKTEDLAPRSEFESIEKLLLDHGANPDLQRLSTISFRRPGWTTSTTLFTRATNDFNRYTLFEFFGALYSKAFSSQLSAPQSPPFPDLGHVYITRLNPSRVINVDLWTQDCADDIPLEWGDSITIPELDHPLNMNFTALAGRTRELLLRCLARRVQIIVKQETNTITLLPQLPRSSTEPPTETERRPSEQTLSVFRLNQVVYGSGLLRTSSDVTKIRVTRTDPARGKQEWTIDLTKLPSEERSVGNIAQGQDLWLRDGDVIEIPDKQ